MIARIISDKRNGWWIHILVSALVAAFAYALPALAQAAPVDPQYTIVLVGAANALVSSVRHSYGDPGVPGVLVTTIASSDGSAAPLPAVPESVATAPSPEVPAVLAALAQAASAPETPAGP